MINRGDIKLAIDMVVNAQDEQLFGGEAEYVINTLEDCGNTIAAQAAEIARLKTVPMKYRRMQFNAELQEEVARLREQVSAQAAVIEQLTKRLASTNIIIEVVCAIHPDSACAKYELAENMNALALLTDSTQILAEVRRAERERVAQMILNGRFLHDESPAAQFAKEVAAAIRAME